VSDRLLALLPDIIETPDLIWVRICGTYADPNAGGKQADFDRYLATPYLSQQLANRIPSDLCVTRLEVFGNYAIGARPTVENALAELNLLRKAQGLAPFPDGFWRKCIAQNGLHRAYHLVASPHESP